jgi:signal transduction histidine kinase/ActR/RegA family two-component response regulator
MTRVSDIGQVVYVDAGRRNEFKRLIESQGFVELFEYEVYRKDRTKIWLCENARAVRDASGAILYYEGTVEDITQRRRVEEVERANKAKSEFLSRVSHELRTPLNAILGFGQLLERQNPTETQRTRIHHILSAGKHLLGLINEFLDISRIESGRMQLSLEPVCVADALTEALDLMRPLATERSIQLIADMELNAKVYLLADRQRFKQALLNLLTNAVKYTPESGRVTVSCDSNGNEWVRIYFTDTGPGIPADKLERLFTPFERLGAEQSKVEGTGLGLALSQRLMHAMGGSIGVESTVGKGSTFSLELPRTKSPLPKRSIDKKDGDRRGERSKSANRKILYIEDNLPNLTLIEQMLHERPEIELLTAMQGKVGLDLARRHSPDLILLDVHLPDLDGREVISELKSSETTRDIPVVVISADATTCQIKRLMTAGAGTYLTKPLDVGEFFRVLDKVTPANNGKSSTTAGRPNGHLAEVH